MRGGTAGATKKRLGKIERPTPKSKHRIGAVDRNDVFAGGLSSQHVRSKRKRFGYASFLRTSYVATVLRLRFLLYLLTVVFDVSPSLGLFDLRLRVIGGTISLGQSKVEGVSPSSKTRRSVRRWNLPTESKFIRSGLGAGCSIFDCRVDHVTHSQNALKLALLLVAEHLAHPIA